MGLLNEFSIQLYSIKDETAVDFRKAVKKAADYGYTGVEYAGYGNLSALEMKKLLEDNNLKSVGSHVGLNNLTEKLDEEIEYHKTLGTEYIICPWASMKTYDECMALAENLSKITEKVKQAGIKFGYHNHAFEFEKVNGEYLLDILFKNSSPDLVMELDLYWTAYAGVTPLEYTEKNKDKIELLHIKQIKDFECKKCVDLPDGVIDFKEIIEKTKSYVKHYILEQEEFEVSSDISLKRNMDYIRSL